MARFALNPDYRDFLSACNAQNVEYLVIGGQAVMFYGYVRNTVEIDVEGVRVPFIQLDDLLQNKRTTGRPQDIADIDVLSRRRR
jgi:hypothetical protein